MTYVPNPKTDCFVHFDTNSTQASLDYIAAAFARSDSRYIHREGATYFFRFPSAAQRNKFVRDYKASLDAQQYTARVIRPELMTTTRIRARL